MSQQPNGHLHGTYGEAPVGTMAAAPHVPDYAPDPVRQALLDVRHEVAKAVVGQDSAVTGMLIALLSRGHVLLEGVPGVAKTLLVRSLAAALSLDSKRVQFTPDLMPGDVIGTLVFDAADVASSASARARSSPTCCWPTRSTARRPRPRPRCWRPWRSGRSRSTAMPRPLPEPFIVVATQNPVEYEGTYPLPEAQLDRFLFKLTMPLPDRGRRDRGAPPARPGFDPRDLAAAGIRPVAGAAELERAAQAVAAVEVAPECSATSSTWSGPPAPPRRFQLGVSPRGATALLRTSRAWAWLSGRDFVTPDDVKALALPVPSAPGGAPARSLMDGVTVDDVLGSILASVPVPR